MIPMPGKETHAKFGWIAAVLIGAGVVGVLVFTGLVGAVPAVALGAASGGVVYIGSLFPDIDHPNSIPFRRAVTLGRVGVLAAVVAVAVLNPSVLATVGSLPAQFLPGAVPASLPVPLVGAGVLLVGGAVLAVGVPSIIDSVTGSHRTLTHSPPVIAALSAFLGLGVFVGLGRLGIASIRGPAAFLLAVAFFVGTLVHIGLDTVF